MAPCKRVGCGDPELGGATRGVDDLPWRREALAAHVAVSVSLGWFPGARSVSWPPMQSSVLSC